MKYKYQYEKKKVSPDEKAKMDERERDNILESFTYSEKRYRSREMHRSADLVKKCRKEVRSLLGGL